MDTKFFTNQQENTLFNKFEGVFTHNKTINHFDVLVGYFRASGYFKLRPLLEDVANIRILVGIDVDEITREMQAAGLALFKGDAQKTIADWQVKFVEDVKKAHYDEVTEQGIKQFIDDMQTGKVQLKAHPSRNIHAKIYIFRPDDFNSHKAGSVITGSSNLTDAGLGTTASPNYEFNVLLNDYNDIQFATTEFEKLWQEGVDILPTEAAQALEKTHLADNITPYQLYLKCLIEYFGSEIEFDPESIKDLPGDFKRLSYQLDAVNEGWEMLKKHNGFFLADVVGLGKTIIATLIARQFIYLGGRGHNPSILLIIPPALKQNWDDTLRTFEIRGKFDIVTNGSLHKVENAEKYDMVIVDEAHKFRNDTAEAYDQLQRICKTPVPDDKDKESGKGKAKKVLLISATPLNNRPNDLYNQILLFQDGNNSSLDFPLAGFFTQVNKEYKAILKLADKNKASQQTAALYARIREKVIVPLMVRRTRTDLLANARYKKDLTDHGVVFPETTPPKKIYYQLEEPLEKLYDSTIQKIDNKNQDDTGLLHTRYRALHYLKPEFKKQYQHADFIAERLTAIMKTLLLKRMDSSFYAFKQTLGRFIDSSKAMLKMIDRNEIIIAPNINVNDYVLEDREDELMERLATESLTDPSIIVCCRDDFEEGFVAGVRHDYKMLKKLKSDWDNIAIDPKLEECLARLPEFLNKTNNPEQKIVLFTESTDTMNYLTEQMSQTEYADQTLSVSAKNRNSLRKTITLNFDANTKEEKRSDYQLLLTTDVLAEGINLHQANTVINYDTPWNATKLMQRIGRVNRIGQTASHIYVYNFYPTAQVNSDIELEKKALIKLQAFHSALGEDLQIYSTDEKVATFGIFDENIEEEINRTIPFLEEIRQFRKDNPESYKHIKELPSKVRNAVENPTHQGGTMVFARTEDKGSSRFYRVKSTGEIDNYSFIQTATLLKCSPDTQAQELHDQHYPQVRSALNNFKHEMERNSVSQNQNQSVSPAEKKAIRALKALENLPDINAEEQEKIQLAIEQIKHKRFQNLTKNINKLDRNSKGIKRVVILEKALNIIKQYDLNSHNENSQNKQKSPKNINPSVVISQSYT